jgi:type I restriction enzyme, S subunit
MPPFAEQLQIVEKLSAWLQRHDNLQQSVELAIARLEEFRSALICAAVTGQIDVRTYRSEERLAAACQ